MRIRKILVAVDPALPHGGTLRTAVQLATAAEAQIAVPWRDPQGVPAVEIVRAADRERADLIVLPRDPRNTLEGTVQRARVPCLVVAPGGAGLGRVLAAIDGGPDSGDVLGAARAIGQLPGSEVLSVRVERWSGCATASLASAGELSGRWGETAGSGTTTLSLADPVIVRQGDPVAEILNVVRDMGIELLVFGHHRGGPTNGQETGSIAARLLARAPCAVLTVPI